MRRQIYEFDLGSISDFDIRSDVCDRRRICRHSVFGSVGSILDRWFLGHGLDGRVGLQSV